MRVYKTNKAEYLVLMTEGVIINREIENDYLQFFDNSETFSIEEHKASDNELLTKLSQTQHLGLSLTENCNFRCTYCPHAGMYDFENGYSSKEMSYDTAVKAIDRVIDGKIKAQKLSKPDFFLSFYGGEPLMAFKLMSKVIPYTRKRCQENNILVHFSISTNGSLLTKRVVDFLIQNKVSLFISLDGPKSEHDKCRITSKLEPTWDYIISNLRYIRSVDYKFFKSKVSCQLTVYPLEHDLDKIANFIESDELFTELPFYSVNWVKPDFLKKEHEVKYNDAFNDAKKHKLFQKTVLDSISRKLYLKNRKNATGLFGLTGNCFPGVKKLFVSPDGQFKICEKFPDQLSPTIGHVDTGYDLGIIRKLIEGWEDFVRRSQCVSCEVWMGCDRCFSTAIDDQGNWETCHRNQAREALRYYIGVLEVNHEECDSCYANAQSLMAGLS